MKDIMETIKSDASLSTLATMLENANLVERLKGSGPYTLFAPNNDAFIRMNIGKTVLDPKNLSD